MTNPTLVILAAGAGSRFQGAKPLAPVGPHGEILLEYSAFDALRAGFGRLVLVVREETEAAFRARLDSRLGTRAPLRYVHQRLDPAAERAKPWGTAQAVLAAAAEVDGPFAVINADDHYGAAPYLRLVEFLERPGTGRRLAAVGFRLADTLSDAGGVSRALLEVDAAGRLRRITEIPEIWHDGGRIAYRAAGGRGGSLTGGELVSMNMWGMPPALLPELERRFAVFAARTGGDPDAEFRLPDVVQDLVKEELFTAEVLPGGREWCGLTFRGDAERVAATVRSLIARGSYPEELWDEG